MAGFVCHRHSGGQQVLKACSGCWAPCQGLGNDPTDGQDDPHFVSEKLGFQITRLESDRAKIGTRICLIRKHVLLTSKGECHPLYRGKDEVDMVGRASLCPVWQKVSNS